MLMSSITWEQLDSSTHNKGLMPKCANHNGMPTLGKRMGIFHKTLSTPQNIVIDLNKAMNISLYSIIVIRSACFVTFSRLIVEIVIQYLKT